MFVKSIYIMSDQQKNQRTVTVVSNQKGTYSIHTSFKKACEVYDWDHKKYSKGRVPSFIDDLRIKRHPFDVSIDCLELLEFIGRKSVTQSSSKNAEGYYEFEVAGYNKEFLIVTHYRTEHEDTSEIGNEVEYYGYDYDVPEDIQSIFELTEDGPKEIKFDQYTENELLNFLNIEE